MTRKKIAALLLAGAMTFIPGDKPTRYTDPKSAIKGLIQTQEESIDEAIGKELRKSNIVLGKRFSHYIKGINIDGNTLSVELTNGHIYETTEPKESICIEDLRELDYLHITDKEMDEAILKTLSGSNYLELLKFLLERTHPTIDLKRD